MQMDLMMVNAVLPEASVVRVMLIARQDASLAMVLVNRSNPKVFLPSPMVFLPSPMRTHGDEYRMLVGLRDQC